MEKFAVDEEGKYYQHRMEEETAKRSGYTKSRRINGSKGGRPPKKLTIENHTQNHMDSYMDNHMGNENINENEIINSNENKKQEINGTNMASTDGCY